MTAARLTYIKFQQQHRVLELAVNLKTALAIGLTVFATLFIRADHFIELAAALARCTLVVR